MLIDDIGLTKGEINAIFKGGITMKKVEDWLINEMRLKEDIDQSIGSFLH